MKPGGAPDPVDLVRAALADPELPTDGPLLVGVSGGRDSLVLLHLLRFGLPRPGGGPMASLAAIHVNHRMRPGSDADARWLSGVCRAWGVPLRIVRLSRRPMGETEARSLRYRAFRREARRIGARRLLLAHHAEDQAETVLFRILRGTGPRGLAGIPTVRPLGSGVVVRPLLSLSGSEVERWARQAGLRPRVDPSNLDLSHRRNWIRHHLLPTLEAGAPGMREALLSLAAEARRREEALERVLTPALQDVLLAHEGEGRGARFVVARAALLLYPEPVRAELLRRLLRRGGRSLGRGGMALALRFCATATSGREVTPGPGVRLVRDFEVLVLEVGGRPLRRTAPATLPTIVRLEGRKGQGAVTLPGGRRVRVRWERRERREGADGEGAAPGEETVDLPAVGLCLPLEVRGRRPGDRVRTRLGSGDGEAPRRRLKKLLGAARVSREQRDNLPLLVDASGAVLWVPGVWQTRIPPLELDTETWTIGVMDERHDP
jgi:tRNA(Ile)-lysidine synthase